MVEGSNLHFNKVLIHVVQPLILLLLLFIYLSFFWGGGGANEVLHPVAQHFGVSIIGRVQTLLLGG